jgi:uncharacterized protein (DUF1015 family)
MAYLYPFRGLRYDRETVGDFNKVVTQPYDKTTPEMQDDYYQRSPYNAVRITLNREKSRDSDTQYPDAGATYRNWIETRVLIQDPQPAMYAYYQEYVVDGQRRIQRGLVALLDLDKAGSGIIPHEHTLAAPKQDRLRLMRSTEGNEDFIYMLYADEKLEVNRILEQAISGKTAEIEVTDEYGAVHRIWAITDPDAMIGIQKAMEAKDLFIADGHHRFETSVNFMHECNEKGWKPTAVESFDNRMVTCFNTSDGVTILPTHRLIRDLTSFDTRSFLSSISDLFSVEQLPSASALWDQMKKGEGENVFGFYPAGQRKFYILRLKNRSEPERELDVSVLHSLLLDRALGIDAAKLSSQAHVDYIRERDECIRMVDNGGYQAAFLLNPTTAEQMLRIASSGRRMPQKSTDFFPKLLTGLVFMRMKIEKP